MLLKTHPNHIYTGKPSRKTNEEYLNGRKRETTVMNVAENLEKKTIAAEINAAKQ